MKDLGKPDLKDLATLNHAVESLQLEWFDNKLLRTRELHKLPDRLASIDGANLDLPQGEIRALDPGSEQKKPLRLTRMEIG